MPDRATATSKVFAVLGALFTLLYPAAVYFGLTRLQPRLLGVVLAGLLLIGMGFRLSAQRREHALAAARVPVIVVALLLAGALFDDRRLFLALPALTNLALLAHFAASLRTIPVAERFARAQEDVLSTAQVAYCRGVTIIWCVFFIANGGVTVALALFAPLGWWTLYTGGLSYVAMGTLAAGELIVRKARFRKYTGAPYDLLLARVFPPVSPAGRARAEARE
jgi:uncharacterized membrane protein